MVVNTVDGGRQAFNSLLYNVPDTNTLTWLNNNINKAREVLTGVADNLISATENLYNKVNSNVVINAAKALVAGHGGHTNHHTIYALDYSNMGSANYIMQQYIMANPKVQELYQDNLCYGFEETYYNPEPDVVGVDRLDYQRVMDGVVYEGEDGLYINHYSNTDDIELTLSDQHDVLDTWQHVEHMLLSSDDPTDPDMGTL